MKVEAIIFDLDGTLLDTLGDLNASCNYALAKYNHNLVSLEQTRSYVGNGIRNLVLKSLNYDETDLELCFNAFKEHYKDNCDSLTKPYDGIYELLDFIKGSHIKMACFSNKAQYALDILVKNHFDGYFDEVLGDNSKNKRKPDPEGLLMLCARMGVCVNNIMYIGDSDVDKRLIDNSGCLEAIVSYGFRSEEDLKNAGVNKTYKSPYELLDYIKTIISN